MKYEYKKKLLSDILKRYNFIHKSQYYSRKSNIWAYIFDNFFYYIYNNIDFNNEEQLKLFFKNVKYSNIPIKEDIYINKTNSSLDHRKFLLTDPYCIINYEMHVSDILLDFYLSLKNDKSFLIDSKYISYSHQFFVDEKRNIKVFKYTDGWLSYVEKIKKFKKEKNYYIETDIDNFYWSIDHNKLIESLLIYFKFKTNIDKTEFLYDFQNILYKTVSFEKKWLLQWLHWSDYLSSTYMWLIFYLNKKKYKIEFKEGVFIIDDDTSLIIYWDDISMFSNNYFKLLKSFQKIKEIFNEHNLKLNVMKTTNILETKYSHEDDSIKIELLKKWDINETFELLDFLIDLLTINSEEIKKEKQIKKYFKWVYTFKKIQDTNEFQSKIIKLNSLLNINHNIDTVKKNKLFVMLLWISVYNVVILLELLYDNSSINLEKKLIKFFNKYNDFIANWTILLLYENIKKSKKLHFSCLEQKILLYLRLQNNYLINSYINNKKQLFLKLFEKHNLVWINNLLYNNSKDYHENHIWIKLNTLFNIETWLTKWFFNFIKENNYGIYISNNDLHKTNNLLNDMIMTKNIYINTFLNHPSFLADLVSLFNQLLTFYISIWEKKQIRLNIKWWSMSNIWAISDYNLYEWWFNDRFIYITYYITKIRWNYNHKEKDVEIPEISYFNSLKDLDVFYNEIKYSIEYLLSEIDKKILTSE